MKQDATRILVEATVRRTLKSIQECPERATRNFVDLGLQFSRGRFQTSLLEQFRKMLQNEKSAYYDLAKRIATGVDHDLVTTFGVNVGYNGFTKGARLIRRIEAERGFNIPWALHVGINEEKLAAEPGFYPDLFRQAATLGIHTFLVFADGDPNNLLPLVQGKADCAFVLFLHGRQIDDAFLTRMRSIKNAMVSVYLDEDTSAACEGLRAGRLLYAVHSWYLDQDVPQIVSGHWLQSILAFRPAFALLRADRACSRQAQQEIYQYIVDVRNSQRYPVLCMEIKQDSLLIDRIISDGECFVGFDANGNLRTHEETYSDVRYNVFFHPLEEILQVREALAPT